MAKSRVTRRPRASRPAASRAKGARAITSAELRRRAATLRMLLLDVDGVMTDGGIILAGHDIEVKRFDVQDGMGVTLAQAAGIQVGILTGRNCEPVRRRAAELKIEVVSQGHFWKQEAFDEIVSRHRVIPEHMAYVGDDVLDIPVLRRVGIPIAVGNARPEVKAVAAYVTERFGGRGAVREVVDWLLALRGEKARIYERFSGAHTDGGAAAEE
jgi:3-deoxy-D-manno-octulosonate 8-phosphate phosphatase (KDO 8-P phosphatase)